MRDNYDRINPGTLQGLGHIRDQKQWRRYLDAQYGRRWKVHFAKKTGGPGEASNTWAGTWGLGSNGTVDSFK